MLFLDQDVQIENQDTYPDILSVEAVNFLSSMTRKFRTDLEGLLSQRESRQKFYDEGYSPNFSLECEDIRKGDWKVAEIPDDIRDRRVEITGPVDRKMIINALNSGANVFMADFEDSLSPTWKNLLEGQQNLKDAVRGTITYEHPEKGTYSLNKDVATLFVRPRGLHLKEDHFLVDGKPIPASFFDFGLFFFHNSQEQIRRGSAPYFYIPKLEHRLEARLWNDLFNWSQDELGIERGTIRATVLIETLPASFQMDEILWELKDHSAGLNCGRWDYIFSYIKTFRNHSDKVLPDRSSVTMGRKFMKSYSNLLIKTCHKRGIHAMGGMAAQIPIKNDSDENERALSAVRNDKYREVISGHDGTWVAHPGLVPIAKEIFDIHMKDLNQINHHFDYEITQQDLLKCPEGEITEEGLRKNINVGIQYLENWLKGNGCVPLYNLMEDAATAEISRTQIWQWIKHKKFDIDTFDRILNEEFIKIKNEVGDHSFTNGQYYQAMQLFNLISMSGELISFLTLPAYDMLVGEKND